MDFIDKRLSEGAALDQAVIDAGAIRFRPMLLMAAAVLVEQPAVRLEDSPESDGCGVMNPTIAQQVHAKFRLFSGVLEDGKSIAKLAEQVEQFAAHAKAAPKSIGIEYLGHSKRIVFSLGYRDDEPAYPVKLNIVSLGKASKLDATELQRVEIRMTEEAEIIA